MLRRRGVVGRFVEYCGPGIAELALADRATIGNMAPEYGATCGFFPIDAETIRYLTLTGARPGAGQAGRGLCQGAGAVARREHARPGLHRHARARSRRRSSRRSPGRAGRRTAWRCPASRQSFDGELPRLAGGVEKPRAATGRGHELRTAGRRRRDRRDHELHQHLEPERDARPPACSRKKAVEKGLKVKPWVKTSLAPGSQVVSDYYAAAGLQDVSRQARLQPGRLWLHDLHRQFRAVARAGRRGDRRGRSRGLRGAVGQPQFRGPHPRAGAGQLPRLAAARRRLRAGRLDPHTISTTEPLGEGSDGKPVYLRDIWPSNQEVADTVAQLGARATASSSATATCSRGRRNGARSPSSGGMTYQFEDRSTYLALPPYFENMPKEPGAGAGRDRRARAGDLRRQHHHRPHLAGRQHQDARARPANT